MTITHYFQLFPIVFPIPIVKMDVNVEAGVVSPVGINAALPMTIWIAKASPNARAIPKRLLLKSGHGCS